MFNGRQFTDDKSTNTLNKYILKSYQQKKKTAKKKLLSTVIAIIAYQSITLTNRNG